MEIVLIVLVIAFVVWWVVFREGNLNFWKTAAKYADEAYLVFQQEDCWFIDKIPEDLPQGKVDGPFQHFVPSLGRSVKIYGLSGAYEDSQDRFLERFG